MTEVSILIKCNDQYRYLEQALPTIANQTKKDIEIIIIYSGTDESNRESTLSLAYEWGVRILLFDKKRPFPHPAALNAGVREAQGEYLVCLSADAVPKHDEWLESLLYHFWCPRVAGVYGSHALRDQYGWRERLTIGHWLDRWRIAQRYRDQALCKWPEDGHLFSNANSAIRRSLWEQHEFDESLTSGCEDYEWARWAHANGYTVVYEPRASAFHTHGERYSLISYLLRAAEFKLVRSQIDARPQANVLPEPISSRCSTSHCPLRLLKNPPP